ESVGGKKNAGGRGLLVMGVGAGGAICSVGTLGGENMTASNLTLSHNQAVGGTGNADGLLTGVGIGGGLANFDGATATVSSSTIDHNQALGGPGQAGGNGGDGLGGGIANFLGSSLTLSDATLECNQAVGGV